MRSYNEGPVLSVCEVIGPLVKLCVCNKLYMPYYCLTYISDM